MIVAVAVTTAGVLAVYLTGTLAVQIRHSLHLSEAGLGEVVATFFGSSALSASVCGRIADRAGGRAVLRVAAVPAACALVAVAVLVHTWWELAAALVVGGAANGAIQPAANRFLSRRVPAARQGLAFGVKQAAIPAAALLSGVAVPLVALTVGWRWAYVGGGALVLICAFALPRQRRGGVRTGPGAGGTSAGDHVTGGRTFPAGRTFPGRRPAPPAGPAPAGRTGAQSRLPLVAMACGFGLGSAAANALGSFFVVSAVAMGVGEAQAGILAAVGGAVSMAVRLGAGHRADRSDDLLRTVMALLAAGVLGYCLLALAWPAVLVPAAVIAYGAGWGWAGLLNFAVVLHRPDAPGRATGMAQVGASTGACLGPLAFGLLAGQFGFGAAWAMAGVLAAGSATMVGVARRVARPLPSPANGSRSLGT